MKHFPTTYLLVAFAIRALATPSITNVTAQQRYPWNGKVDISYTVSGDIPASAPSAMLKVTARDETSETSFVASSLTGDTTLTDGTHSLVWDMEAQGLAFISTNVIFSVSCEVPPLYCVIDLTSGANASSYPVTYLDEPPSSGFNVNAYKTTKLVLRLIAPGTFMMCGQYQTTLTKPYYIGIFEVTQEQYKLVTGNSPSKFSGKMLPVERVCYIELISSSSFISRLRSRTGLDFDLPTEAQWEYACRAGTTTVYSYGDSADGDYMWYNTNSSSQTHNVGTKLPNPWGLYDMHGNVQEWCLDWYGGLSSPLIDPKGSSSGSYRVLRGGSWGSSSISCTSSKRSSNFPAFDYNSNFNNSRANCGFRLVGNLK
ncbi:MAG: formylglycine-generating enzyme family protein [Kiritimatiellae bacterium]|nr:formylglycine-generating enzyme family protein [Kiritimatiellia bacterium]